VLATLGIWGRLLGCAAKRELGVGILFVKCVVVDKMLGFEDDNDERAQFLGHCQEMAGGNRIRIRSVVEGS
jgi:hypothetical protein